MKDLWPIIIRSIIISAVGVALAAWALKHRDKPPK